MSARASLGEDQAAGGKIERGQADLSRDRRSAIAPAQASGDHQVEHQEQLITEIEDDPFTHPLQADDGPSLQLRGRRLDGADDEGIAEPKTVERLTAHARSKRLQIELDVG